MAAQWKQIVLAGDDLGAATATSLALDTTLTVGEAAGTTGSIILKGTTSGAVTIKVADAAGTYSLTLPTDDGSAGQQLTTDGDGVLSWAASGAGATALDDIGDPDADTTIALGGYILDFTSTMNDAKNVMAIHNTTADLTANVTLLSLSYVDDNDANGIFFECLDNTSDSKFKIGADGATTINGILTLNTGLMPDANDGAYLGDATHGFSDLYFASGAVIGFDNGDVTLTHSANTLTIAGATALDFSQTEILGLRLDNASSAPNSGTETVGQMYYDTDDDHPYVWCAA